MEKTDEQLKEELLSAVKKILKDAGYSFYLQLPPFCDIKHRINTEIDIKITAIGQKEEKQ